MKSILGPKGEHELQERFGTQKRAYAFYDKQMLDHLNPLMRDFIAQQEMVFIATADSHRECDSSFRGGLPGFVQVLNDKTLVYPEYRGNGILASLGNISENPHVGMFFVDFFNSTVGLHVNGKARIIENDELINLPNLPAQVIRDTNTEGGGKPERWVVVEVEEAYIHCSKHIPLLKQLDKKIHWGTDDVKHKGGDFFQAKSSPRPRKASGGNPSIPTGHRQMFRYISIATIALAGAVHLLIVPEQFSLAFAHGTFFALIGILQLVWAITFWRYASPRLYWTGLAVSGGPIIVWVLAQLVLLPFVPTAGVVDPLVVVGESGQLIGFVAFGLAFHTGSLRGLHRAHSGRRAQSAGCGW